MITPLALRNKFLNYWNSWVKKRNRLGNPQIFNSHNLYILPSGFGWAYGVLIFILFLSAINYQLNTLFLMCFLLFIIGLVSAWEAHANLKYLSFKFLSIEDAQQGTPAKITLFIQTNNQNRFSVDMRIALETNQHLENIPSQGCQFILPIETSTRGYFPLKPIIVSSLFPFGIFKVWGYIYFDEHYYVYPQAIDPGYWPESVKDLDIKNKYSVGDEEFYELKQIENPWSEPSLIAWKIAAKNQGWYLKKMQDNNVDYWLFKLSDISSKDTETALQYLSYWLQIAESNGLIYSLQLEKIPTKFARGKDHLQYCLRQLALYK